jgi:uncharacterized membrane-anchored protein
MNTAIAKMESALPPLNKVPEITMVFWIIKKPSALASMSASLLSAP